VLTIKGTFDSHQKYVMLPAMRLNSISWVFEVYG
jgi:hypothetical protein